MLWKLTVNIRRTQPKET